MTELLKNLHLRRIRAEDAADISGIQTALTNSREFIDFKQVLERQVHQDKDASFGAERNGQVVGSYILFPALKASRTTMSQVECKGE